MLGGLAQSVLTVGNRSDFTGQAQFTEHDQIAGQGARPETRQRRGQQGEVGPGFGDSYTANDVGENVLVRQGNAAVPMQYGQMHREPLRIEAHGDAPRIAALNAVDQSLDLHQQRARAFPRDRHHAARRDLVGTLEKDRRRVGDLLHAFLGHGEDTELVDRAEAVFLAPQGPVPAAGGGVQPEEAVDHVL